MTVVPAGEVGAEPHPVGVGDAHARTARRSRSSAGTCRRRRPPRAGRAARRRSRVCSKPSTAQGPALVQTTLGSAPKMPSRLIVLRRARGGARAGAGAGRRPAASAGAASRSISTSTDLGAHAARLVGPDQRVQPVGAAASAGRLAERRPREPGVEHLPVVRDRRQSVTPCVALRHGRKDMGAGPTCDADPRRGRRRGRHGHIRDGTRRPGAAAAVTPTAADSLRRMPSTSPSADLTTPVPLDLSADVTSLTAAVCDIESVSQDEARARGSHRGRAAPAGAPPGVAARQHGRRPHLARTCRACRPGRAHRHGPADVRAQPAHPARRRRAVGPRHRRHEGRRRRHAAHRRPGGRADPRPHLPLLRVRGDRREVQRPCPRRRRLARAARG